MRPLLFLAIGILLPIPLVGQTIDVLLVTGRDTVVGPGGGRVNVGISCPNDYVVISGGWESSGADQLLVPVSYRPSTSNREWIFQFVNNGTSSEFVHTQITCIRPATASSTRIEGELPDGIRLYQNYPNPFNPYTTITYDLPSEAIVEVLIYNMTGQLIRTFSSGRTIAGTHSVVWDGKDDKGMQMATGAYFYRLQFDDNIQAKKMILLK